MSAFKPAQLPVEAPFVGEVAPSTPADPADSAGSGFAGLDLPATLLERVQRHGYTQPTPVQVQAIPLVRAGRDVAAEAQTGSGKTAAFVLPLLATSLERPPDGPDRPVRVLVLVPTRELAQQVAATFKTFSKNDECRVLVVIGGASIDAQLGQLYSGIDVIVATPGRLLDLLDRGALRLRHVQTLVLDEADRLLDLGFRDELATLLAALPAQRQTLLFSATLPQKVRALGDIVLRDPVVVRVGGEAEAQPLIEQRVYQVDTERRRPLLQHLLASEQWRQTLVFVATQRATENLARKLRVAGISATALHGGLDQVAREQALARFKRGVVAVLVATDLAARGIDVPQLDAVVNFDLPRSPQTYVHRIGRTGRAGESGVAISFVDHQTELHFRLIEKRTECWLARRQLAEFPLTGKAPPRQRGAAPVKGKRKSKKDKLRAR